MSTTPIADIQALVAEHYELPARVMRSREMAWPAPEARQVAMYLAYYALGKRVCEIGRRFNRDHTTVAHGVRKVAQDDKLLTTARTLYERWAA